MLKFFAFIFVVLFYVIFVFVGCLFAFTCWVDGETIGVYITLIYVFMVICTANWLNSLTPITIVFKGEN